MEKNMSKEYVKGRNALDFPVIALWRQIWERYRTESYEAQIHNVVALWPNHCRTLL